MFLFKNSSKENLTVSILILTKIDDSFPNAQFKIEGYRKDPDAFGGGLPFYLNAKLNCRSLEICLPNTIIEILPLKLRLVSSSNFKECFDTLLAILNHQVFMSKTLRKAIMKRAKLRNTFNKKRSSENW